MDSIKSLGKRGMSFLNWGKVYTCTPELYFEPSSITEIRQILAAAQVNKKTVRVITDTRHSFNNYMYMNDYIINMKKFNEILEVRQDQKTVKVQAGVTCECLNTYLRQEGLALPTQTVVEEVTFVGAISTGSHGPGTQIQGMASYVTEMKLMTSSGEVMTITSDDEQLLNAARVSVGMLGIILSVTIQCVDSFNIERKSATIDIKEVLSDMEKARNRSDFPMILWFPQTGQCVAYDDNRVAPDTPCTPPRSQIVGKILAVLQNIAFWISSFLPFLLPWASRWLFNRMHASPLHVVGHSYQVLTMKGFAGLRYSLEWSIPMKHAQAALGDFRKWILRSQFPIQFPIFIRFGKADDIPLSMSYGTDVCYMNLVVFSAFGSDMSKHYGQLRTSLEEVLTKYHSRPHWGKNFSVTKNYLRSVYPKLSDFQDIRKRMDPTGMFLTSQLRKWMGDDTKM